MDEKQRILNEIRRIANEVSPERLTKRIFAQKSQYSISKVRYRFGSFTNAVTEAGLTPNPASAPPTRPELDDDELLKEIGRLWKLVGRRPTQDGMNAQGQYSTKPYCRRWGTFGRAIDEYVARNGLPQIEESGEQVKSGDTIADSPPPAPLVVPRTYKPKADSGKSSVVFYGEPIDFRGLRYAPVNEQGVVYLFGMVSGELGFLIESVRTSLPDCEGKRSTNKEGTQWQHVRIEFEYRSKNFLEHGHDSEQCEMIVCWEHNWEECPLEVLELKTILPMLPKKL